MENTVITASTGASAWAPTGVRTLSPISPMRAQGTRLPFAPEYAATSGLVLFGAGTAAHKTADAMVPDPRGRTR